MVVLADGTEAAARDLDLPMLEGWGAPFDTPLARLLRVRDSYMFLHPEQARSAVSRDDIPAPYSVIKSSPITSGPA